MGCGIRFENSQKPRYWLSFLKKSGCTGIHNQNNCLSAVQWGPQQLCGRLVIECALWEIITIKNVLPYMNVDTLVYIYFTG